MEVQDKIEFEPKSARVAGIEDTAKLFKLVPDAELRGINGGYFDFYKGTVCLLFDSPIQKNRQESFHQLRTDY